MEVIAAVARLMIGNQLAFNEQMEGAVTHATVSFCLWAWALFRRKREIKEMGAPAGAMRPPFLGLRGDVSVAQKIRYALPRPAASRARQGHITATDQTASSCHGEEHQYRTYWNGRHSIVGRR